MSQAETVFVREQQAWLADQFRAIPGRLRKLRPSEWAEQNRYLPPSVTPLPGAYSFDPVPYLREPLDCLSVDNPVREVTCMKGSQLCFTTGVLENFLGYLIGVVRTSACMLVTADSELAKIRLESYMTPMLQHSGLTHLIKSIDEKNTRKTGKTDKKWEWDGGGFLIPQGAQNANKMRSSSIRFLLNDEIDGWPDEVGKDGDPMKLVRARTDFYESSRKILNISTPTIKGQSKIETRFLQGDQRYYWVCCLKCAFPQVLKFSPTNAETGVRYGLVWELEHGRLASGSVRYICQNDGCGHAHINEDKVRLLSPENGAEWRPAAQAASPHHRSYHLSALYSPPGTRSWEAIVEKWLEAWDVERNRPRDLGALQVFYNNELGAVFELRGERLKFEAISAHRRHAYQFGQVPNKFAVEHCGGSVLILVCTVDVHKDYLAVAVIGWCRDKRAVLVDYKRLEGDTEQKDDPGTWGALRKIIESQEYGADDGKRYGVRLTLIDSGYRTDHVLEFCSDYDTGVFPVKGRQEAPTNATIREFSEFQTKSGSAFGITVDLYKDRLSASLRRSWDGLGIQPPGHFNAPLDATDAQLKELTVEVKREKIDKDTGKRLGVEWHRPSGAANELWDLYVYASAALDIICFNVCRDELGLDFMNWPSFYEHCEQGAYFEAT